MLRLFAPIALLIICSFTGPTALAQAAIDCAQDVAQCQNACAGERTLGIFRGKKYRDCSAQCEERIARTCGERNQGGAAVQKRGDKEHPQGKEYGYEKNADRVKGQYGDQVSSERKQDSVLKEEQNGDVAEMEAEDVLDAEKTKDKGKERKKEKGSNKSKRTNEAD